MSYIQPAEGCNSGHYYYRSDNNNGRANAFTSFDGYCWGNKTVGARVIAGSTAGAWAWNWATVHTSITSSNTAYGQHMVNGGHYRTT